MSKRKRSGRARARVAAVAVAASLLAMGAAAAAEVADEHAAHRAAAAAAVRIVRVSYEVPDVTLEDERGESVALAKLLASDQPVILNFIFTSCTSICPVMTATMLQLERQLAAEQPGPRFVSISIDPDYDNAAVLRRYADRYNADWTLLTGRRDVVLRVLQAFDAWRGNKGNHIAITLMRRSGSDWMRVEGLNSASELAELWKRQPR